MDPTLGSLVFETVKKLVTSAASSAVLGQVTEYFKRRRIENAVERAVLAVVEPLAAFLENEKITPVQREILMHVAEQELLPFVHEPSRLFSGSLNGDTMYRQIRSERPLPQEIREERLEGVYELLVPRMGTVLCSLLPILDEWKTEAWRESFRRFDEMADILRSLLGRLDADAERANRETDVLLARVRRGTAQREAFRMDLTALRSDAVISCGFDVLFIHPALTEQGYDTQGWVDSESQALATFLAPGAKSVVIGVPGAGKSTWLRWLERTGNDVGWSGIIIRIELRRLLREATFPSYLALVKATAGSHLADEVDAAAVGRWRDAKRLVFLVDGFDEVPADERDRVYGWIAELTAATDACPIVLASRPLTTDHLCRFGAPWRTWSIDPFDERRIVTYIDRWYTHAELPAGVERGVSASDLARSWMSDSTIHPLTDNPLLLATLLLVHVLDGNLPTGRAKLYQRYVDGMLGLWDDRQKRIVPKVALTSAQKRTLLRDMALRMFLGEVDEIEEAEAIKMVEAALSRMDVTANASDALDLLRERTGLLVGPGVYSFTHKTVAEFLVAETIVDGSVRDAGGERMDRMRLFRHHDDDRWMVVFFLWAGLAPTVEFEQFVMDLCNKSGGRDSWALAFGLLDDQSERASKELWAACIEKFAEFQVLQGNEANFSSAPLGVSIRAPTIHTRGLRRQHIHAVFGRAQNKGQFPDLSHLAESGRLNAALQWHIAINPSHYGGFWRRTLQAPEGWSRKSLRAHWAIVAVSWSFRQFLNSDEEVRKSWIAGIREFWPEGSHEIALTALWALSREDVSQREISAAVQILASIEAHDISEHRLICSWRSIPSERRTYIQVAVSAIQSAISSGAVSNAVQAECALRCARTLDERFCTVGLPP